MSNPMDNETGVALTLAGRLSKVQAALDWETSLVKSGVLA